MSFKRKCERIGKSHVGKFAVAGGNRAERRGYLLNNFVGFTTAFDCINRAENPHTGFIPNKLLPKQKDDADNSTR